ncbi:unnamed protein product [Coffea canephora]|uniref:DH200=94 genomic scaffold, scaffold_177 n=1 Tax=Coffea canephora TaxID=49390 RepID=A0A068VAX6_COFCA|nr:unnamed protein product [Coffea canephora]
MYVHHTNFEKFPTCTRVTWVNNKENTVKVNKYQNGEEINFNFISSNDRRALKTFSENGNKNQPFFILLIVVLSTVAFISSTACSTGNCQLWDPCASSADCGPGLHCGSCPSVGKTQPFCAREKAIIPTSIEPAIDTLKEVEAFLNANPTEIVSIIIEDYVHAPKGLTKLFANAGLDKYCFPLSKMPKNGEDWPTIADMIQANYRLLVFTSDPSKEETEGVAYQWNQMVENERISSRVSGSSPNRKESKPLNSNSSSLFLQNYFPTIPDQGQACKEHSVSRIDMVNTCYKIAGNIMPNFLAVNFYSRSAGGGVFDAVDRMNGRTLCGCTTVTACQAGTSYESCKSIPVSNTTLAAIGLAASFPMPVQLTATAATIQFSSVMATFLHAVAILFFLFLK